MFHYTIAENSKFTDPNEANQSVTQLGPPLTVQVGLDDAEADNDDPQLSSTPNS
jgi:hypothetical protein